MKERTKLIIGIGLPIIVIVFVVGAVLLPQAFFKPQYDFLYTIDSYCTNYDCRYAPYGYAPWTPYKVVGGKVMEETRLPDFPANTPGDQEVQKKKVSVQVSYPRIFKYSVSTDSFMKLSLEEAQKFTLTDGGSAPDGTVITNDTRGGGLANELLGGGRSYGLYLKNGAVSKKIIVENGGQQDYYYNNNFRLVGWIIK